MFGLAFLYRLVRPCLATVILALLLGVLSPTMAQAKTTEVIDFATQAPGSVLITNPCALAGQGDLLQLVGGRALMTYDRAGRLLTVVYQDVVATGSTGDTYRVTYSERHQDTKRTASYRSELRITGGGAVFTEVYRQLGDRPLVHTQACAAA